MSEAVHASPTKDFFISMITRDISLDDCILDLLDNCLDGARAVIAARTNQSPPEGGRFRGFHAAIIAERERFDISDNCGGMSIAQATDYAFHFGRRRDAPRGAPAAVGLYGIGMKRAIFKIGQEIVVRSSTTAESFSVPISVPTWATAKDSAGNDIWDFELEPAGPLEKPGTTIEIRRLNTGVADEFGDGVFITRLVNTIARDYSMVLREGFGISVNGVPVRPFQFGWLVGEDFSPVHQEFEVDGVTVEIIAGSCRVPTDDDSPGEAATIDTQYYGWFVVCNDRVVLAGNKDGQTVWGDDSFPSWHPQFNGFNGIVHFRAADPKLLPWTTTKRGVDETAPVYRQAVDRMKTITRTYIDYTNARKQNLEEAKRKEQQARLIVAPAPNEAMAVPVFTTPNIPPVRMANISYAVPEREYHDVATALGDARMAKKTVGLRTFEFFRERMVEAEG